MTGVVFLLLAALCFLVAIHPFTFYPWSLNWFPRRRAGSVAPSGTRPTLAVCMSVYNEERVIAAKVEGLIAMAEAYGPATILVYVDGTRDRTHEILDAYRDRVDIVTSSERRGKTAGLKALVSVSSSELIAFTDANVVAPVNALVGLAAALHDPGVGCAGVRLVYTNPGDSATSRSGAVYWSLEERVKERESETIGLIGVDGALFMIRRDAYEPPPDDIIDDLYVSLVALSKGYHVVSVPEVVVGERSATSLQEEFRRKARISCQAFNVHRLLWPRLRRLPAGRFYGYISHRLLKWLAPYFLLAGVACVVAALFSMLGGGTTLLLLTLAATLFWLGLLARVPAVVRARVYMTMLAGVGVGVFQSLVLGCRYATWNPAPSVREG